MLSFTDASGAATLAHFITSAAPADLPVPIRLKAARHTLDTLACGLAGAASTEARALLRLMLATEPDGGATVWGTDRALAPRSAALINGVACHAFELDDTGGCDHSGAVVLPAALASVALADRPVSGAEFLLAVVLGYDVARRVLEACGGYSAHNEAGWHSTATCGTFGAATAAARILGIDASMVTHALGHAASFSGGLWGFIHDGSQTKRIHAGRAAEGGLLAALLARAGVTGPAAVFQDCWGGFLPTFARQSAIPEALTAGLGDGWRLERVSLKPYASCRGTHSAIDALGMLLDRNSVAVSDIEKLEVRLSPFLRDMCGGRDVSTLAFAQMSLPYALVVRATLGQAGLSAYSDEHRSDPALQAVMARIALVVDPRIAPTDEPFVELVTKDGRSFDARVLTPLGSPANPLSDDALLEKVHGLAGMALEEVEVKRLVSRVMELWDDADMRWLPNSLASGRPVPTIFT